MFILCSRCNAILFKLFVTGLHCVCFMICHYCHKSSSRIHFPQTHIPRLISQSTVYSLSLFRSCCQPSNTTLHGHISPPLVLCIHQIHARKDKTQVCTQKCSTGAASHTHARTHTRPPTHQLHVVTQTNIIMYASTHAHARTHASTHTYMHVHACTVYSHRRTCIHTRTCTDPHSDKSRQTDTNEEYRNAGRLH